MKIHSHDNSDVWKSTKRIETLVDGIFAIAMTLLVLSLNVPSLPNSATNADVIHALGSMSTQFFLYALSFILLATFWRINHSQFYLIKKTDQTLLWINILWLLFVALVPFSTNMVGDYGNLQAPVIFFDLNLFFIGLLFYLNWYYADKKDFIDPGVHRELIESQKKLNLALPSIALIAMALTFISPGWSSLVYITIFFIKKAL